MPNGPLSSGNSNALNSPAVVIRPIRSSPVRVNHMAPSGPAVMIDGRDCSPTGYTVTSPPLLTRAIEPLCTSVTHIAPSGPAASAYGPPSSATLRAAVTRE
jgi:hypothetical protein